MVPPNSPIILLKLSQKQTKEVSLIWKFIQKETDSVVHQNTFFAPKLTAQPIGRAHLENILGVSSPRQK